MDKRPVGVMDSGVGGLTVASVLRRLYPEESIVYFGDSRRNPYGERPPEEIARFASEIKAFLLEKGVKAVIVGCNTITFNVPASFYEGPVPVVGMSLDFSGMERAQSVAVFATPASIATHAHRDGLARAMPGASVIEVPCDGLAHAIESSVPAGEIRQMIRSAAEAYHADHAEVAVFGCTHYPLVRALFEEVMPHTRFWDPAEETVRFAMARLAAAGALSDARGADHFYFSAGLETAAQLAAKALGQPVPCELAKL